MAIFPEQFLWLSKTSFYGLIVTIVNNLIEWTLKARRMKRILITTLHLNMSSNDKHETSIKF